MKIKLTANSIISLPAHFANMDIGYGYSAGINTVENDTWMIKLASKVDKVLSFFKPLNKEQKKIIHSITESAQFLNSHISQKDNYIKELHLQINVNSPFNRILRSLGLMLDSLYFRTGEKIFNMVNPHLAYISFRKKIFIGTDVFRNIDGQNALGDLKDAIGLDRATKYLVYHESSHSFEHTNILNYGAKFDPIFTKICNIAHILSQIDYERGLIDQESDKRPELNLPKFDLPFLREISVLQGEIYADIGSVLLQRNQDIADGVHSCENDLLHINSIIEYRYKDQLNLKDKLSPTDYICHVNHFTSPGLEYLRDNCNSLPIRSLSQEEIHEIAHKATAQGLSRILIAMSVANKNIASQLKKIFSIEESLDGKFYIPESLSSNIYTETMVELKKHAGEQWVNEFTKNIHKIYDEKVIDHQRATWHAAFYPKQFKKDLEHNTEDRSLIDNIFGSSPNVEQFGVASTKTLTELAFGAKATSFVLDKIKGVRGNNTELEDKNKRSP